MSIVSRMVNLCYINKDFDVTKSDLRLANFGQDFGSIVAEKSNNAAKIRCLVSTIHGFLPVVYYTSFAQFFYLGY